MKINFLIIVLCFSYIPFLSGQGALDTEERAALQEVVKENIKILKNEPRSMASALALMEAFYRLGDYRKSLLYANVAEDILSEDETDTNAPDKDTDMYFYILQTRGKARHKLADYRKAEIDYINALNLKPGDSDLLVDIGNLYYNQEIYDSALYYFRKAERFFPEGFKSKFNMANTFYVLKEYDSALIYYDRSIAVKDDFPFSYFYKGSILNEIGEFEKAIPEFSKALKLWPDKPELFFRRGFAYQSRGEFEKAVEDWNMVLLLDSTNFDAIRNRALAYMGNNKQKFALNDLDYLIMHNPAEVNGFFLRGRYYYDHRKNQAALTDILTSIRKGTKNPEAYYIAGKLYRKKGDRDNACIYLKEALSMEYQLDNKSKKFLKHCE